MKPDIQRAGTVARITVTAPDAGYEVDAAAIRALQDAIESLREDPDVRGVVITGANDSFAFGWLPDTKASLDQLTAAGVLNDPFACLTNLPKPVIAAVNGEASGGGLALALAADIRIASETGRFALPDLAAGRVPLAGVTQHLARLVGRGNGMHALLSGDTIDAQEALRIGLVSEAVPAEALVPRACAIVERIAQRGPLAVQYAKEAIHRGLEMPLEQALRYETDLTIILQATEDRAEGVRAFLEKRAPEFKGK